MEGQIRGMSRFVTVCIDEYYNSLAAGDSIPLYCQGCSQVPGTGTN